MPFPETKKYIYKNNPLDLVICQVRFPAILKIDNEDPFDFQEIIREKYPDFSVKLENQLTISLKPVGQLDDNIAQSIGNSSTNKNYQFLSEDSVFRINLTKTFLAISTKNYLRWTEFKTRLNEVLEALQSVYKPPYFTRVGLRYTNIINRSLLGIPNEPWDNLLKPYILGIMSSDVANSVIHFENKNDIQLSDKESNVRVVASFVKHIETEEKCIKIDSDLSFSKKCPIDQVTLKLDSFNQKAYYFFQWIIKDKLHQLLEPEE